MFSNVSVRLRCFWERALRPAVGGNGRGSGPATGRGGTGDRPRLDRIERLQLSLRREQGIRVAPGGYGVEVESVTLGFALSGRRE